MGGNTQKRKFARSKINTPAVSISRLSTMESDSFFLAIAVPKAHNDIQTFYVPSVWKICASHRIGVWEPQLFTMQHMVDIIK